MLYWALVFFILALVASLFGFGVLATSASMLARVLFIVFVVLAVAHVIRDVIRTQKTT